MPLEIHYRWTNSLNSSRDIGMLNRNGVDSNISWTFSGIADVSDDPVSENAENIVSLDAAVFIVGRICF